VAANAGTVCGRTTRWCSALGHQQRLDLLAGVIARRLHRLNHQPRLPQHFFPRVVLQKLVRDRGGNSQPRAQDNSQNQVEFRQKFHLVLGFEAVTGLTIILRKRVQRAGA